VIKEISPAKIPVEEKKNQPEPEQPKKEEPKAK